MSEEIQHAFGKIPVVPVVLCGGSGKRLWPLSREDLPKPFLKLYGGPSLFDKTLARIGKCGFLENPVIICNEDQGFLVLDAMAHCKMTGDIILEPEARNTAPAIVLGALAALEKYVDPILLIMPSDHLVSDTSIFFNCVKQLIPVVQEGITGLLGAVPNRPECGFGYIKAGESYRGKVLKIKKFIEKPDFENAEKMYKGGGFYWNCGIFLTRASTLLNDFKRYAKEIFDITSSAWEERISDRFFIRPGKSEFLKNPSISIDFAVLEHSENLAMIPFEAEWNDLGSWISLYETARKDEKGNVIYGDAIIENVHNCYIYSQNRPVAAIGVEDLIIIECAETVLVMSRNNSQDVTKISEKINKKLKKEAE